MLALTMASLLFVAPKPQYVFCVDQSDAYISAQDGMYIDPDLKSCKLVSAKEKITTFGYEDLESGERVWKIKLSKDQQVGYLIRKGE